MRKFELHDLDIKALSEELEHCEGPVWMTTEEGDKLNLKSAFCRVIGLISLMEGGRLSKATIHCDLPEDESRLFRFNLYGKDSDEE